MTLPLNLLWQGLICREHATAFHLSGRHFLMSSTGMFMNGILIVPLDHSLMSFMAPWSDWTLQLRNSSVGLRVEKDRSIFTRTKSEINICLHVLLKKKQTNLWSVSQLLQLAFCKTSSACSCSHVDV